MSVRDARCARDTLARMARTGWKPDLQEHRDQCERMGKALVFQRFGARMGESLPVRARTLMEFCRFRDQMNSEGCVGFTLAGAAYTRLQSLGFPVEEFSAMAPYTLARMLEGIYKNKPLPDQGSYPFLAVSGLQRFGLPTEKAWPFDWNYRERISQEIPVDVFQKASQFRISWFARIDAEGDERVRICKRALSSGHPVPLGMMVGDEFKRYRKGLGPVGVELGDVSGHMTYLVGYEDDGEVFIGANSWGEDYGDQGFYRIHRSKLEHESTSDLYDFTITETKP